MNRHKTQYWVLICIIGPLREYTEQNYIGNMDLCTRFQLQNNCTVCVRMYNCTLYRSSGLLWVEVLKKLWCCVRKYKVVVVV